MKNTQVYLEMAAEPRAINIPLKTSAMMIPTNKTNCCFVLSILNRARIRIKINKLSIDSEYSVIQPAKNSFLDCVVFQTPRE